MKKTIHRVACLWLIFQNGSCATRLASQASADHTIQRGVPKGTTFHSRQFQVRKGGEIVEGWRASIGESDVFYMIFRNRIFEKIVVPPGRKTIKTTYMGTSAEEIVPEVPEARLARTLAQVSVPVSELRPLPPDSDREPMNIAPVFALLGPALLANNAVSSVSRARLERISVGDRVESLRNKFAATHSGSVETLRNSNFQVLLRVSDGIVVAVYSDDFFFPGPGDKVNGRS